jgi:hypothetical protein
VPESATEVTEEFYEATEAANNPWPLRGCVWGRNRMLGLMIPNEDVVTAGGIVLPQNSLPRPKACRVVKLSDDIPDWSADKDDTYKWMHKMREQYKYEYENNLHFEDGPAVAYLAGSADETPFYCSQPPEGHWLRPFWYKKHGAVIFCRLDARSVIFSFTPRISADVMDKDAFREGLAAFDKMKAEAYANAPDAQDTGIRGIIMKGGGFSPNRV